MSRRSGNARLYPHTRIHLQRTNWVDFPLKMVSYRPYVCVCVCVRLCYIELSHSRSLPFWIQIVFHVVFSHGWLWSLYEASNSHIYLLYIIPSVFIHIVYILLFIFVVVIFFPTRYGVRLCVMMSVCFHSSGNRTQQFLSKDIFRISAKKFFYVFL